MGWVFADPYIIIIKTMKYLLNYVLLLLSVLCLAQNNNTNIQVEYKMYCDTDVPLTSYNTLFISNNISVYKQKTSTTERWTEKPSEYEINLDKLKSDFEPYIKIDKKKKEMLFFDAIGQNIFLVKDNYSDMKWDITNEKKNISGYECVRAVTNYRGREWIAWFTPEVALPFGPWKLHGLPGLILEANDTTNRYAFKTVRIENIRDVIFDKEFGNLIATKNKKPMPIIEFFKNKDEFSDNQMKILLGDKNLKFEITEEPRKGEELKYEWEQ